MWNITIRWYATYLDKSKNCRILGRCFTYYTWPVVLRHLDCLPYVSVFMRTFGVMESMKQDSLSQCLREAWIMLRSPERRQSILVSWSCISWAILTNKIPQIGWLINNRNLSFQKPEVWPQGASIVRWGLSSGSQTSFCALTLWKALIPFTKSPLLWLTYPSKTSAEVPSSLEVRVSAYEFWGDK